jgi:hypothetical protein
MPAPAWCGWQADIIATRFHLGARKSRVSARICLLISDLDSGREGGRAIYQRPDFLVAPLGFAGALFHERAALLGFPLHLRLALGRLLDHDPDRSRPAAYRVLTLSLALLGVPLALRHVHAVHLVFLLSLRIALGFLMGQHALALFNRDDTAAVARRAVRVIAHCDTSVFSWSPSTR